MFNAPKLGADVMFVCSKSAVLHTWMWLRCMPQCLLVLIRLYVILNELTLPKQCLSYEI
jgi:hypothetical protein